VSWPRRKGTHGATLVSDISCSGLAIDYQRCLYITDFEKHEVRRFQLSGENRDIRTDAPGVLVVGGNGEADAAIHSPRLHMSVLMESSLNLYQIERITA
jgi:hypothetical protein